MGIQVVSSERLTKEYGLEMLYRVGQAMESTLDLDKLLYVILTCVTAGGALGFSRAMILLVNHKQNTLEGKMGVGPSNAEEAHRIWSVMDKLNKSWEELVVEYEERWKEDSPFNKLVKKIVVPLEGESSGVCGLAIKEKKVIKVTDAPDESEVPNVLRNALKSEELIMVPLIAQDKSIGLVIADNAFSNRPLEDDKVQFLILFSGQAGLAIENAKHYRTIKEQMEELERAEGILSRCQDELFRFEELAMMGRMAAYIAHEMRNPLVTMGGFALSILENYQNSEIVKRNARIISEEIERLEGVLENMLSLSRPLSLKKLPKDINQMLERVCGFIEERARASNISLEKIFSPLPLIMVDPRQMKQAFLNIINNAADYMPQGGKLTLVTQKKEDFIKVKIKDTGKGIPEELKSKVFQPFFTTKSQGIGLGLAITQRVVKAHHGGISVESGPGKGTTFIISLPFKEF
jgi:hypothetical protein